MSRLLALLAFFTLTACASGDDLDAPPAPLGNFALGHTVVLAPNLVKGPLSREATREEWEEAVSAALKARFGRYEGDRLYHLGVSVEGYVLAQPGIPLVAAPKSVVIVNVTIFDDATGTKMNEKPHQISVVESFGAGAVLGSGLTQSREEQLAGLATRVSKEIELWLVRQKRAEGWFNAPAAPVETVEEAEG